VTDTERPRTPPRDRGARWWARRSASAVGVLLLAFVLAIGVSLWSINRSIDRVEVDGLGPDKTEGGSADDGGVEASEAGEAEEVAAEPITVLVLGSDSREELTEEERRELGTGYVPGDRTEVMALTRLDPDADEVRILSVPRDSYIERCDGTYGRANSAFEVGEQSGRGGITCSVETLKALTGTSIDHVVRVDFGGFVEVVDELGGVTMYLDQPLQDDDAHLDLPAGCVELDGRDALAFVRARHIDDDYGRIARQQRFVEEVRAELAELGVFRDLPRAMRVAEAIASSVELDSSLTFGRLQSLVRQHRETLSGGMRGRALPGVADEIGGAWVLDLTEERVPELVTWLLTGEDPGKRGADGADADDPRAGDYDDGGESVEADAGQVRDGTRTLSGDEPVASETEPSEDC
jgi:LCP family protein required for cell wall assembly